MKSTVKTYSSNGSNWFKSTSGGPVNQKKTGSDLVRCETEGVVIPKLMQLIPSLCNLSLFYGNTSSAFRPFPNGHCLSHHCRCSGDLPPSSYPGCCRPLNGRGYDWTPRVRSDRRTLVPGWVALLGYSLALVMCWPDMGDRWMV